MVEWIQTELVLPEQQFWCTVELDCGEHAREARQAPLQQQGHRVEAAAQASTLPMPNKSVRDAESRAWFPPQSLRSLAHCHHASLSTDGFPFTRPPVMPKRAKKEPLPPPSDVDLNPEITKVCLAL